MAEPTEFDYQAETARVNFQGNVSSLLEIHSTLSEKISTAKANQKKGVFLSIDEMDILNKWLLQSTTNMMADYTIIDRTNRLLNKNYNMVKALLEKRTPNLKTLLDK